MGWRDLLTNVRRAQRLSTGLTAKRLQRIAQGFNPGLGSQQNRPERATDVKSLLAAPFGICADKPVTMTPRHEHPPILQRGPNRSPFQGEAWDGTYPGLKPWAILLDHFMVKNWHRA
jgi:hypothetical protein